MGWYWTILTNIDFKGTLFMYYFKTESQYNGIITMLLTLSPAIPEFSVSRNHVKLAIDKNILPISKI